MRIVLLLILGLAAAVGARELQIDLADLPRGSVELRVTGRDLRSHVVFGPRSYYPRRTLTLTGLPAETAILRLEALESKDLLADFVTTLGASDTLRPAFVDVRSGRSHSFMVLGCNRLNLQDQSLTRSSANEAQLVADFQEVQPSLVFFTGDLVMAQQHAPILEAQLPKWQELWERVGGQAQLAPMPGNHELLYWDDQLSTEIPDPPTGEVWSRLMAPYLGSDGPTLGVDGVQRDESRLSYTFRRGTSFFVCVNTETWQGGLTAADTGRVPLGWLKEKLAQAQADPSVENVFVFGHKPVSITDTDDPLPTINPAQNWAFYALLEGSPKVRAYLCAHAHRWSGGIPPNAPAGSHVPQLIAGNAGSVPDDIFKPGYYGYTLIHVLESGSVTAESWGRPIPTPYSSQDPAPRCSIRERFTLFKK